ncbi:T9SS type A sorting domain-containing protein [Tamlana sp. 2_MG-2023]|uniref:T9SS type A sorting domain-containing protein n=1 Tax=unclassified Tamlana TaxID=2614803 RepID=UPI0026E14026|nr:MULTISPECIES: T9SS type A sorting domain-containing protein [unclassified Tamlana]MDO6761293.1 T9SS type A sorting domain-containing protein [Tamlana sp. 2_MG-2023]MDO6791776.1 T9SS type A sorting domain-containing protein [Tamlana sp. 1_MG-2023]
MKTTNLITFLFFLGSLTLHAKNIYVSKSGSDSASGTEANPYLTISKAASVAVAGDIVFIKAGTYRETVQPSNSGNSGNPIVFKAYGTDEVIISALEYLDNWVNDSGAIYKTNVSWDLGQANMLMANYTVLDVARWPNNTDGDPFTLNSYRSQGGSSSSELQNAYLLHNQIPNINWDGANIMFYGDRLGSGWTTWREYITGGTNGRVNFTVNKTQSWIISAHPPADGGDFYLEGAKGLLDYQNEWWFDPSTKTIYVQLPGGASPKPMEVQMRKRVKTIDLSNRSYVEFHDLAVIGGRIELGGQGNRIYKVSSYHGDYNRGVAQTVIADCRNVYVKWASKNNIVEQCEIAYGGGSGIFDQGENTQIINNYVHDFNYLGDYNAPVSSRGIPGNTIIRENTVKNGGRDAIQNITKGSEVSYNDVSHSNIIADDCGLFYTINAGLNMEIHHNWFHDAESRGSLKKAAGIYLDNNASNVNVYRNVVWNTEWTSVQINHNGENINIFNNSFAKNIATMGAWHMAGTQFTNVKVWNNITDKEGSSAGGQENEATWEPQSDKQNNLVDQASYQDWTNNNYHLKTSSQAVDYGKVIPGYTDGYAGAAPDVGAYEVGDNWIPGVSWDITMGPSGKCYSGLVNAQCHALSTDEKEVASDNIIKVYPNPVQDILYVNIKEKDQIGILYDVSGRMVRQFAFTVGKNSIQLSDLKAGIYFLKFKGNSNTQKLIKQ